MKRIRIIVLLSLAISMQLYAEEHLTRLLASSNPQERKRAYDLLKKQAVLTDQDISSLINDMKTYQSFGRSRPDGPDTQSTPLTELLIQHSKESLPHLKRALSNSDENIRRYSAYCLGQIGKEPSLADLQRAILAEIARASKSKISIPAGLEFPSSFPDSLPRTYVLRAMVEACGRIDSRKAVIWFLQLFTEQDGDFRNYAANLALNILLKEPPMALSQNNMYMNYKRQWEQWWKQNSYKPDNQLFKDSSPQIALTENDKSDPRADVSELFKGYEESFLCSDAPCNENILDLFRRISDKTKIAIRPIARMPEQKYSIYRLNAKDTFLFLIDSAHLSYEIKDRTITVASNAINGSQ